MFLSDQRRSRHDRYADDRQKNQWISGDRALVNNIDEIETLRLHNSTSFDVFG